MVCGLLESINERKLNGMKKEESFVLDESTYFTPEANMRYLDCSSYKQFVGTCGKKGCECRALAIAKGEYKQPKTPALLLGSYVDRYFDGTLAEFMIEEMDNLYTKASIKKFKEGNGDLELLSDYKMADVMIKRAIREPLFMKYVNGETQKILTAEIGGKYEVCFKDEMIINENLYKVVATFQSKQEADRYVDNNSNDTYFVKEVTKGVPIRVKLDSYDGHRITDIKTAASISETYYAADLGQRLNFAEYFGYIEQAYFYQTAVEQNYGKKLPFYLAVITKEKYYNEPHPRVAVIHIPDGVIENKGKEIQGKIHNVWNLIQGEYDPVPCGCCEWCADNLPLKNVISLDELMLGV